jgi:hypothetical protein
MFKKKVPVKPGPVIKQFNNFTHGLQVPYLL